MKPWEMYGGEETKKPWEMYAPIEEDKVTKLQAGARGLEEMASLGFTDELRGFGRAIGSKIRGDERSFTELTSLGKNEVSDEYTRAKEQQPGATLAGEIAGAIIPALTPGGQAIAARMGAGGLGARIAKGAGSGAATLGAYGFGTAEGNIADRSDDALRSAVMGAAVGGGAPAALAGLGKLNASKVIVPGSDEIKSAASALYKSAEQKGGVLRPQFTNKFIKEVKSMAPQTDIGKIFGGDSPFAQSVAKIQKFKNRPMTLQAAQEFDELLSEAMDGFVDATTGKLNKQGNKLLDIQSTFRKMIEDADDKAFVGGKEGFEAIKEARKLWATSRRLYDIEKIIKNADNYQVPATAIKTGFRNMLNNPSKLRGFSPTEVKAIEKAAKTGIATDLLSVFGSRLGPIAAGAGGFATMGPVGGAAAAMASYATSTASRGAASAIQKSKAQNVAKEVAKRAGVAQKGKYVELPQNLKEILKLPPNEAKKLLAIQQNQQ